MAAGRIFAPGVFRPDRRELAKRCPAADGGRRATISAVAGTCPFGVPPSPSRLLALMPPRPSATGTVHPSAVSQPRRGSPAAGRILIAGAADHANCLISIEIPKLFMQIDLLCGRTDPNAHFAHYRTFIQMAANSGVDCVSACESVTIPYLKTNQDLTTKSYANEDPAEGACARTGRPKDCTPWPTPARS